MLTMVSNSRWLTNLFIVFLIFMLLIEGLPTWHHRQEDVRNRLAPFARRFGIEQNGWQLYAPIPDYWNLRIRAEITYPDGDIRQWQSPDWSAVSSWQKMRLARHINYYEFLADVESSMYWPHFADLLHRTVPRSADGRAPTKIQLSQHWAEVPPLKEGSNWQPLPEQMYFTWNEKLFAKDYK